MRAALLLTAALLTGCASMEAGEHAAMTHATPSPALGRTIEAPLVNGQGSTIGTARFREGAHGVVIRLDVNARALSPGWHGAHLHQNGDCADFAAGFQASGAHVKHDAAAAHGLLNPTGPDSGDLPNIFAPEAGAFGAELYTANVTLAPDAHGMRAPLLTGKGAALIVHANADDYTTQPIGGAGARVACAAIKP